MIQSRFTTGQTTPTPISRAGLKPSIFHWLYRHFEKCDSSAAGAPWRSSEPLKGADAKLNDLKLSVARKQTRTTKRTGTRTNRNSNSNTNMNRNRNGNGNGNGNGTGTGTGTEL